jgi:hypothetical protein
MTNFNIKVVSDAICPWVSKPDLLRLSALSPD